MNPIFKGLLLFAVFVIAGLIAWGIGKSLYILSDDSDNPATPADGDDDSWPFSSNQEGVS